MITRRLLLTLSMLLAFTTVFANGYQVVLQGARQTGMGNVGVGYRPDGSSIFFNPGAMSFVDRSVITIGASAVMSKITYNSVEPFYTETQSDSPVGTPFYAYGVYKFRKGGASAESEQEYSRWTVGLGIFTPFGSTVVYPEDWDGRDRLQELSLQAIYIQPTVSFRVNDVLSIGAGFDYILGSVELIRTIPQVTPEGQANFSGDANAYSFNVGAYLKPADFISVGLNYRHGADLTVEGGSAKFDVPTAALPAFGGGETQFDATLPMPSVFALGLGIYPADKWGIGLDINYIQWSAYESLKFDYEEPIGGSTVSEFRRDYEDSWTFNFGVEYLINEMFDARAGVYYDLSPVQDGYLTPESPDANAIGLTLGIGANLGDHFVIDATFLYNNKQQRTNTVPNGVDTNGLNGVYKAQGFIPSLGLSYKF